jgi:mannose-1-phosphate guanylyltransferase/mannose-1-phosphate guanylyltransferase/mannose-6-phosphate isomerase
MSQKIIPVILSGGSGSRLWPQSRQYLPKPFAPLFKTPLFEQTLYRVKKWGIPYVVTNHRLQALTEYALKQTQISAVTLYEPVAKNTAPAIAWLCWELIQKNQSDAIVAIFPSDHLIQNESLFHEDIKQAAQLASLGRVVILGVPPTHPETGYGYIEKLEPIANTRAFSVKAFHEKPHVSVAKDYVNKGYLWNAGVFISQVKTLWSHFKELTPDLANKITQIKPGNSNLKEIYESLVSISIDFAVMEKLNHQSLAVLPTRFDWSDLGTWDAMKDSPAPQSPIDSIDSINVTVYGLENKLYSSVGVHDVILVDTEDALMLVRPGEAQKVSQLYERIKSKNPDAVERHVFEQRPWGDFRVLKKEPGFKTKLITVLPGAQLSYQSHEHRSEHWVVVEGLAEVILDDIPHALKRGDYIFIQPRQKHRLKNIGKTNLKVIEVQIGSYLGEDDIKRFQDNYGRS